MYKKRIDFIKTLFFSCTNLAFLQVISFKALRVKEENKLYSITSSIDLQTSFE